MHKLNGLLTKKNSIIIGVSSFVVILLIFTFLQINNPNSLPNMLKKADKLSEHGKLALALEQYNKIVRLYPSSLDAHLRLGDLYFKVNEPDSAKVEYYRALNLNNKDTYKAAFAMANVYISENNYEYAEGIIDPLKDSKNCEVLEKVGDFYYDWGQKLLPQDILSAIRQYNKAYLIYKKARSHKIRDVKNSIEAAYATVAGKLIKANNPQEAERLLNISLKMFDNASAHYKLALIYENKDIDRAMKEYEKAFSENKYFSKARYIALLVRKGTELQAKGKMVEAKLYYEKANNLNPSAAPADKTEKMLIIDVIGTKYSDDPANDRFVPGITYRIMNLSNKDIKDLKAKIVFYDNNKHFSETIETIATNAIPFEASSVTPVINSFSPKPIPEIYSSHNIRIQIYISQQGPNNWKLYRNTFITRKG